jgi:lysyl-tRNA synthetase, class II
MSDQEQQDGVAASDTPDENKLIAERRSKLSTLRAGGNPFPNDFRRTGLAGELQRDYGERSKEDLEQSNKVY